MSLCGLFLSWGRSGVSSAGQLNCNAWEEASTLCRFTKPTNRTYYFPFIGSGWLSPPKWGWGPAARSDHESRPPGKFVVTKKGPKGSQAVKLQLGVRSRDGDQSHPQPQPRDPCGQGRSEVEPGPRWGSGSAGINAQAAAELRSAGSSPPVMELRGDLGWCWEGSLMLIRAFWPWQRTVQAAESIATHVGTLWASLLWGSLKKRPSCPPIKSTTLLFTVIQKALAVTCEGPQCPPC